MAADGDQLLLSFCAKRWRKIANIIGGGFNHTGLKHELARIRPKELFHHAKL
jgi:hypothetical protein